MKSSDEAFIISIGLALITMLFIARVIAIKLNRDPLMKKYKPGSPEYAVYQRLVRPRRFITVLAASILAFMLFGAYALATAIRLSHEHTPSAHYMLIFGPVSATAIFIVGMVVVYNMIIKKQ